MIIKNSEVHQLTMFILSKIQFPSEHRDVDILTVDIVEKYVAAHAQATAELKKRKVSFQIG